MSPDSNIRWMLEREEQEAREDAQRAFDNFRALVSNLPSGLPRPDGVQRIRTSRTALSTANARHEKANRRLIDFLAHGTVPEDLKLP